MNKGYITNRGMKKLKKLLVFCLVAIGLVGCSDKVDVQSFDKDMDNMRVHMEAFATGGGDYKEFEKDVKSFNDKLQAVKSDDDMVKKFVEFQLKANETRLKGVKDMDSKMITDSSEFQYLANNAYSEIK